MSRSTCIILLILWIGSHSLSSCYSFKNVSIPADLNYFFVEDFRKTARNAPPTIHIDFVEELKNKIRNESRLVLDQNLAQVVFEGAVTGYFVQAIAPQPGETVGLSRLNVTISITYKHLEDESKNWTQNFSEYAEYSADAVLADVEDELLSSIFSQITEVVFNKAFGDW